MQICEALAPALDKLFPPSSGVRVIAEPGQFYVTKAFTLCIAVIGKKMVYNDLSKKQSDGIYSFFFVTTRMKVFYS